MPTKVNSLGVWAQARNTLTQNLTSTLELLETEPASTDPASPFQIAEAKAQQILDDVRRLAVTGLRQIDDEIASGTLVTDIADLSKKAKAEADRLSKAAKTIDGITKAVDSATEVVTAISGLPFL